MVDLGELLNRTYIVPNVPIPRPLSAIEADRIDGTKEDRKLRYTNQQFMDHRARIERAAAKKRAARKDRLSK